MVRLAVASLLTLALTVYAAIPDPSGDKNIGNGQGGQFITGQCLSNADCASNCCAQLNGGVGVCSGVGAQFQAGKTGCGFVDNNGGAAAGGQQNNQNNGQQQQNNNGQQQQNNNAAGGANPDVAGSQNVGNGQGQQFITGQCLSNADCASNCCAQQNGGAGVCSGVGAQFEAGKTGCGFVDQNGGA